jgi:molybdopterin-guanine dinucleotide biosynthesis protein A
MIHDCTGVILAGGSNKRFPGKKKAFHMIGDTCILESIFTVFSTLFKEIILVVNSPRDFCGWDMTIVTDIYPHRCALAGIHAGLFYSSSPYAFVTACDTPFVNPDIVRLLSGQIAPRYDVIIPRTDDGLEPLSAVYSKACLPLIEENLNLNKLMIKKFFRKKK